MSDRPPDLSGPARAGARSEIWTVPNLITLGRLLCLPVFVYLLFGRENRAAAAWTLGALGATDWVDGYVARRFDQVSELGKILDPVADRLLFFVGIGSILIDGSVPVWVAVAVVVREAIVSAATIGLALAGAARMDVTWVGKSATLALMFAFPLFLGSHSTLSYAALLGHLAWAFAIPGVVLSWYSLAAYVPVAREALDRGRS